MRKYLNFINVRSVVRMNSVTNYNIFLGILFKFVISFEQISCNAVDLNHAHHLVMLYKNLCLKHI